MKRLRDDDTRDGGTGVNGYLHPPNSSFLGVMNMPIKKN